MRRWATGVVACVAGTASSLSIGRSGLGFGAERLKPLHVETELTAVQGPGSAELPHHLVEDDEDRKPAYLSTLLADLEVAKERFLGDEPCLIHECVPEDALPFLVEADEARGCAIDFGSVGDDFFKAMLVKMEGNPPHGFGVSEALRQLGNYALALRRDGVEPELISGNGMLPTGGAKRRNPDAGVFTRDDQVPRFFFELDHKNNSPAPQVYRVKDLFTVFGETVRNIITVKIRDRKQGGRFGVIPAFGNQYRRDDDNNIHVVRSFQLGNGDYEVNKTLVREAWKNCSFVLDPAVDDGSANGFRLEHDNRLMKISSFPSACPAQLDPTYFEVAIEQADFFYGVQGYQPPANPRPLVFDLYNVMSAVDDWLPHRKPSSSSSSS